MAPRLVQQPRFTPEYHSGRPWSLGHTSECLVHLWQGQKDLNPRPSVLETDALPTELYPCGGGAGLAAKGAACKVVLRSHVPTSSNPADGALGGTNNVLLK